MIIEPFDYPTEALYCARCGTMCEPTGHMTRKFLLCPHHGEFTIAPIVVFIDGRWQIEHRNAQAQGMWETCRLVDALPQE